MSKSIKIFDYAHECLRIAQEQRKEDGWVNGSSLEQIASEAIIFWASHGDNSITSTSIFSRREQTMALNEGLTDGLLNMERTGH